MITVDELVQNYLEECDGHLAELEKSLLAIELGGAEIDHGLSRALAAVHSIKTGAVLSDLPEVGELAHLAEHALNLIRGRRLAPTPDRISVLLGAADRLQQLLANPGAPGKDGSAPILAALAALSPDLRPADPAAAPGRIRTLLVEDEATSRLVLETFLARYGACDIALNGREAVARFQSLREEGGRYDLICMDIMMPEMDGIEALQKIREAEAAEKILPTEGAKIVMTTAVDDFKQVARCFWDLCDAYLVKPIDLAKLLNYLKTFHLVA